MNDLLVLSFDLDDTLWAVNLSCTPRKPPCSRGSRNITGCRDGQDLNRCVICGHDRGAISRAQPRHDIPAPSRLRGDVRRGRTIAARADEAFEVFYAARNRVKLYDEVEASLDRLSARYGCSRSAMAMRISSAAESRTGSRPHHRDFRRSAKPDIRIFERLLGASRGRARRRCCTSAMIRISMSWARPRRECRQPGSIVTRSLADALPRRRAQSCRWKKLS